MTPAKPTAAKAASAPEEVQVTIKLPKLLHAKMVQVAAAEGKPLAAKLAQAVREHAAGYERTSKTVSAYTRKKPAK